MNTDKLCQSCAMPLRDKQRDNRGTERDGGRSEKYCVHCYRIGEFVEPNITYDEMVKRGIDGMQQSKANFIQKFIMKKSYPTLLKQIDRWK